MKKYLQYNAAQYLKQANEINVRQDEGHPVTNDNPGILDLSGKSCQNSVAMVAGQKWKEELEQDSALDLSQSKHMEDGDQYEALDLSKPSIVRSNHVPSPQTQPPDQSQVIGPTHQALQSLANTSQSKPLIGQYSLLQAALNSTPPITTMTQGLEKMAQLEAELRVRLLAGGINALDPSRGIKPFSTVQSRPLGITVPHFTMPSSSIAVVQGIHKPVAITTPQPHQSLVNSKGNTVSQSSDISQSNNCSVNPQIAISQSEFIHRLQHVNQSTSPKGIQPTIYIGRGENNLNKREQFIIRAPDSTSQINQQNFLKTGNVQGFVCSQCQKMFKNKAALKLHTTVHKSSEERQYECQVCQRRFLHRHHLVVHQRKHSGEKPFKCNACSKTFMAIFLLHKHLRKHVRESGNSSDISTEQLKQLHVRKITSDGPYGNLKIVGNVTNPITVEEGSEKQSSETLKENANLQHQSINITDTPDITNDRKTDDNVISISSDELNSSTSTLSSSNMSVEGKKVLSAYEVHRHLEPNCTQPANDSEIYYVSETISKSDKPFTESIQVNNQVSLPSVEKSSTLKTQNKAIEKTAEKDTKLIEEINKDNHKLEAEIDPYANIGPDEEVELDFITGELRVVGKKEDLNNENIVTEDKVDSELDGANLTIQDIKVDESVINVNVKVEMTALALTKNEPVVVAQIDGIELAMAAKTDSNEQEMAAKTDKSNGEMAAKTDKSYHEEVGCTVSDKNDNSANINNSDNSVEDKTITKPELESEVNLYIKLEPPNIVETAHDRKRKSFNVSEEPEHKKPSIDSLFEIKHENELELKENKQTENIETLIDKRDVIIENIAQEKKVKRSKKGRRARCELCCRTFHSNHHLLLHMAVHKKNPMLMSLRKAKANQMKVLGYNAKSSVNCNICKKVFKFQKSLNSHMRVHSEKLKQNKLISKAFRDFMSEVVSPSQKTQSHVRNGSESRNYSTEFIKPDSSIVKENVENETVSEPLKLTICNEQSGRKMDIEEEPPIKVIIGKDLVRRFLCHACNNTYTTKQKLKMHALIHKDNCFLCDICGKSFFREATLDKHVATHLLPRPYVCSTCKKSFIHRSSLMRHRVVHEKPLMPSLKQQVADVNFELKMLDTYTMLQQERIQKIQSEKIKEIKAEPMKSESKTDIPKVECTKDLSAYEFHRKLELNSKQSSILDLSVRVKMDDPSLPPVLSPAISQSSLPPQCTSDLSPPLITKESTIAKACDQLEQLKQIKQEHNSSKESENGDIHKEKSLITEKRKRSISCSNDTLGPNNTENNAFQKSTRKTRVYETSCRVCREKFPNVMSLKSHMAVHNTVETHLYECHICQHRFTQSCSLLRHLKTSCQENRMTCLPCGKTFHRRNTFDQHMKLHQVGPPSLDGSFYDKRRDEAEIKEEVERESDIENNNTKAAEVSVSADVVKVKDELPSVLKFIPSELNTNENTSDSTDSDARTYLYSEGEIHMGPLSDFSDSDCSPPQSPKPEMARTVLPDNNSPNTMTLNLLSAVCSDIRNAEKEEEQRKREMEERQKELETIEILANLKREAMRNSIDEDDLKKQDIRIPAASQPHQVTTETQNFVVNLSKEKSGVGEFGIKNDISVDRGFSFKQSYYSPVNIKTEPIPYTSSHINRSHMSIEQKVYAIAGEAKVPLAVSHTVCSGETQPAIPTVVLEATAEAETLKQAKLEQIKQNQVIQVKTGKDNMPIIDDKTQTMLKELSKLNVYNSIIQERLSLLMKAQPSTSMSQSLASSSNSSVTMATSPSVNVTNASKLFPTQIKTVKPIQNPNPHDLSVKRISDPSEGTDLAIKESLKNVVKVTEGSRSNILPTSCPPLVPMIRCVLCERIMYNHVELCTHMREHNISPETFKKRPPIVPVVDPQWNRQVGKSSRLSELPSSSVSSVSLPESTTAESHQEMPSSKPEPPSTLDLSFKPSTGKLKLVTTATAPLHSPSAGSDVSDAVSSPSTPSAGSLDHLRIELRNKIYARRRSQGLEDLTVEFKSPEPTEMTEEEQKKLNYRRECNRQAAQRSRMRKKDLVDTLLEELHKEEIVNSDLRRKMESLLVEKSVLLKALDSHTCVNINPDKSDKG